MIRRSILLIGVFLGLLVGLSVADSFADQSTDAVMQLERVIDGDTFVASGLKIRLWGIDVPGKNEPHFQNSTLALQYVLESGALTCAQVDTDRYKRAVMQCSSDGVDVGSLMVRAGFARDYARFSKGFYAQEEDAARQAAQGLWQ